MINRAELIKLTFILLLLVSCTQKVVSNKAVDNKILVYEDSVFYESY